MNNDVAFVQEPQALRSRRPAVVVPAVWQTWRWPALPKRGVLLSAAAAALALGLSVGGVALFHRRPDTLASSVPRSPEVLVADLRETDQLDATPPAPLRGKLSTSAAESDADVVSVPKVTQSGNETFKLPSNPGEVTSRRTSTAESDAVSVPKVAQSGNETSKLASNPGEVTPRRTISPGDLSRPIAKSGRLSVSSESAPILGAQENLLPRIDIRSLDSILSDPPTPTGGHLKEPRLISSPPPVYPGRALTERVQGVVVIDALVDATGRVKDMKAISGPTSLIQPAMDALRTWKYEPARLNDQPIEIHTTVHINFSLR